MLLVLPGCAAKETEEKGGGEKEYIEVEEDSDDRVRRRKGDRARK